MARRDAIFPAGRQALYEKNRYSAAIRSGGFLFVSGQVGSREDGSPEPDFAKQVQLAFDNLTAVLKAAGCTFDDVVDVTTFHTDPAMQWETIAAARLKDDRRPTLFELDRSRVNGWRDLISRSRSSRAYLNPIDRLVAIFEC